MTTTTPTLSIPLMSGGALTIPNPPATEWAELDRLERLADERARKETSDEATSRGVAGLHRLHGRGLHG